METKYLYLYKVSTKHFDEVYVAAESQAEAVEKVKDTAFEAINPFELSVAYVDKVTV